jgi:hypothetical protein
MWSDKQVFLFLLRGPRLGRGDDGVANGRLALDARIQTVLDEYVAIFDADERTSTRSFDVFEIKSMVRPIVDCFHGCFKLKG